MKEMKAVKAVKGEESTTFLSVIIVNILRYAKVG